MVLYQVVFIVLMLFWLFFGSYMSWDKNRPVMLSSTIVPWICVAILGYVVLFKSSL